MTTASFRLVVAGLAIVLVALGLIEVRAEQTKTAKDGVYTEGQAKRGEGLYGRECASCHAPDLSGSGAPALSGSDFFGNWDKMSVADLVEKIATSMPVSAAGSISREQATDLVAFILKSNSFPAGSADLDSDPTTLKTINIVR